MPLKKLAGVFLCFEKNYKNKMTVCDCGVFLGNLINEHLLGGYLVWNSNGLIYLVFVVRKILWLILQKVLYAESVRK